MHDRKMGKYRMQPYPTRRDWSLEDKVNFSSSSTTSVEVQEGLVVSESRDWAVNAADVSSPVIGPPLDLARGAVEEVLQMSARSGPRTQAEEDHTGLDVREHSEEKFGQQHARNLSMSYDVHDTTSGNTVIPSFDESHDVASTDLLGHGRKNESKQRVNDQIGQIASKEQPDQDSSTMKLVGPESTLIPDQRKQGKKKKKKAKGKGKAAGKGEVHTSQARISAQSSSSTGTVRQNTAMARKDSNMNEHPARLESLTSEWPRGREPTSAMPSAFAGASKSARTLHSSHSSSSNTSTTGLPDDKSFEYHRDRAMTKLYELAESSGFNMELKEYQAKLQSSMTSIGPSSHPGQQDAEWWCLVYEEVERMMQIMKQHRDWANAWEESMRVRRAQIDMALEARGCQDQDEGSVSDSALDSTSGSLRDTDAKVSESGTDATEFDVDFGKIGETKERPSYHMDRTDTIRPGTTGVSAILGEVRTTRPRSQATEVSTSPVKLNGQDVNKDAKTTRRLATLTDFYSAAATENWKAAPLFPGEFAMRDDDDDDEANKTTLFSHYPMGAHRLTPHTSTPSSNLENVICAPPPPPDNAVEVLLRNPWSTSEIYLLLDVIAHYPPAEQGWNCVAEVYNYMLLQKLTRRWHYELKNQSRMETTELRKFRSNLRSRLQFEAQRQAIETGQARSGNVQTSTSVSRDPAPVSYAKIVSQGTSPSTAHSTPLVVGAQSQPTQTCVPLAHERHPSAAFGSEEARAQARTYAGTQAGNGQQEPVWVQPGASRVLGLTHQQYGVRAQAQTRTHEGPRTYAQVAASPATFPVPLDKKHPIPPPLEFPPAQARIWNDLLDAYKKALNAENQKARYNIVKLIEEVYHTSNPKFVLRTPWECWHRWCVPFVASVGEYEEGAHDSPSKNKRQMARDVVCNLAQRAEERKSPLRDTFFPDSSDSPFTPRSLHSDSSHPRDPPYSPTSPYFPHCCNSMSSPSSERVCPSTASAPALHPVLGNVAADIRSAPVSIPGTYPLVPGVQRHFTIHDPRPGMVAYGMTARAQALNDETATQEAVKKGLKPMQTVSELPESVQDKLRVPGLKTEKKTRSVCPNVPPGTLGSPVRPGIRAWFHNAAVNPLSLSLLLDIGCRSDEGGEEGLYEKGGYVGNGGPNERGREWEWIGEGEKELPPHLRAVKVPPKPQNGRYGFVSTA
ncbi:hypothetical protein AcW1_003045 [Taiwanofungus camphoratus]|nr:hypothetical protein AcW1_003045 [Antrodia cinnamomea]